MKNEMNVKEMERQDIAKYRIQGLWLGECDASK